MTLKSKRRLSALSILAVLALAVTLGVYFVSSATADEKKDDKSASSEKAADQKSTDEKAADAETGGKDAGKDAAKTAEKTGDEKADAKAPIPVKAIAVASGRVADYISATANLVPENEVKVLAEWEGRLDHLEVEEGDRIRRDQVLAGLDREDSEILYNKAKVRASTAELAFERAKKLHNEELLSNEEFDKTSLEYQVAEQELAEADWQLKKTLIRAPFDGRVTERIAQPGQHVRRGDELFTVADFDPLIARIFLPEKDVLHLEEGREVRISLKADETIRFPGRIRQISPVVDTATGTVKVTIEASNPPRQVRPGAFVRVDVVREARAAATLVPREAVVRELQKAYLFVVRDGVAEKRAITLGIEEEGQVEVLSGAEPGEQVIVAGQGGLKNGSSVELIADEA